MKINRKKYTLTVTLTALALLVSVFAWYYFSKQPKAYVHEGINYAPPTSHDKDFNDSVKQEITDQDKNGDQEPLNNDEFNRVNPVISAWGQPAGHGTDLLINGYVPSIIETDGQCTVTLEKDEVNVSVSKASLVNAQNTSCGQLKIAYSSLSPGVWKATLTYKSMSSEGTSAPVDIEVK